MKTLNDLVCTTPFPFTGNQTQERASGLKSIQTHSGLVPLTVLAEGPDNLQPGDVVYVRGVEVKSPYGSAKFKLPSGKECIFVPKLQVLLTESATAAPPAPPTIFCTTCGLPKMGSSNEPLCNCINGKSVGA